MNTLTLKVFHKLKTLIKPIQIECSHFQIIPRKENFNINKTTTN